MHGTRQSGKRWSEHRPEMLFFGASHTAARCSCCMGVIRGRLNATDSLRRGHVMIVQRCGKQAPASPREVTGSSFNVGSALYVKRCRQQSSVWSHAIAATAESCIHLNVCLSTCFWSISRTHYKQWCM